MVNRLFYTDSIQQKHQLSFNANTYDNLMEFIRDQGYEDWGDCRGRAWCGTCHIDTPSNVCLIPANTEELARLSILTNKSKNSRLACQIRFDEYLDGLQFTYLGDD